MADTVLTELKIHEFDSVEQMSQYESEIGDNDLVLTPDTTEETLNEKADTDLGNIPTNYDYVVESQLPTSANGYAWYRKYKSGWVEQGGRTSGTTPSITITFPVVMADANYTAVLGNLSPVYEQLQINTRSTTNMVVKTTVGTGFASCLWQVSGMAVNTPDAPNIPPQQ